MANRLPSMKLGANESPGTPFVLQDLGNEVKIMKKQIVIPTLLLVLTVLVVYPVEIHAQTGNGELRMERLERELGITDEVLQRAREALGVANNALASMNLAEAAKRQN